MQNPFYFLNPEIPVLGEDFFSAISSEVPGFDDFADLVDVLAARDSAVRPRR